MVARIYADFNNLDSQNRPRLTACGTLDDLHRAGVELREGLNVVLYMDDADESGRPDELRLDGVVQYNAAESCWVADVDWSRLRHASDESRNGTASSANAPGATTPTT